jgi:hypothetical protein
VKKFLTFAQTHVTVCKKRRVCVGVCVWGGGGGVLRTAALPRMGTRVGVPAIGIPVPPFPPTFDGAVAGRWMPDLDEGMDDDVVVAGGAPPPPPPADDEDEEAAEPESMPDLP